MGYIGDSGDSKSSKGYNRLSNLKEILDNESSKENIRLSRLKDLHENMLSMLKENLKIADDPLEINRIKDAIKYQEMTLKSLEKIKE
jgi:hypothetical protein